MQDVIIVAELGPNPAPLAELIWALYRHQDLCTSQIYLLVNPRTLKWFRHEFLSPGGALEQLRHVLGESLVSAANIYTEAAEDGGAQLCDDAHHTALWNEARWSLPCVPMMVETDLLRKLHIRAREIDHGRQPRHHLRSAARD